MVSFSPSVSINSSSLIQNQEESESEANSLNALITDIAFSNTLNNENDVDTIADSYLNSDNISFFKLFTLSKIESILNQTYVKDDKQKVIFLILKHIYNISLENDSEIIYLSNFFLVNVDNIRLIFDVLNLREGQEPRCLLASEIEKIKLELENSKSIKVQIRINKLLNLSSKKVFTTLSPLQSLIDKKTLERFYDFLTYDEEKYDPQYSGLVDKIDFLYANIGLLEELFGLRKAIGREIIASNHELLQQSRVEQVLNQEITSSRSEFLSKRLISMYASSIWEATFQYTVKLICQSYESNQSVKLALKEMGFDSNKDELNNFFNFSKFNQFMSIFFSDKDTDDLVDHFLGKVNEDQLEAVLQRLENLDADFRTRVFFETFNNLRLRFEDL